MEELKYYIPDIEDIKIGYKCEINSKVVNSKDEWSSYIIGFGYENITIARALNEVDRKGIRVPYLTKEQIEAEGWKHQQGSLFIKNKYGLAINFEQHLVTIGLENNNILYKGNCKSINELRTICKLLNVC